MTWQTVYTVLGALVAAGIVARALAKFTAALYRRARAIEQLADRVTEMLADHEDRLTTIEGEIWPTPRTLRTPRTGRGPRGSGTPR